ncbi:early endosome antigen 1-like [Tribolium madens]|uniref:early endosome antigen 1-like n=1 Tax=Tribolium madens TaxID=41895 RepID=UPI001CF764A3|nr:early endosome antigen 1-like [Tribolium madens]XP_044270714.1 early endosome antigen 1-like [Tribolium madens]
MDKTINFSIFKEKIIKTNELLGVLLEKNKTLDKTQQWTQQLKLKLQLGKNEIAKLKLRNETLSSSLKTVESNYKTLEEEHTELKKQFSKLESESSKTINNLQVNYQLANQELNECRVKLTNLEHADDVNNKSGKKKKGSPLKKKNTKAKDCATQTNVVSYQVVQWQSEKEKLHNETVDLQLEVYELKNKLSDFQAVQEIDDKLKTNEQELAEIKIKFDESIKNKDVEISHLLQKIKGMENEIERLKEDNCSNQVELSLLQKNNIDKQDKGVQVVVKDTIVSKQREEGLPSLEGISEHRKTPIDEEVCDILQKMTIPSRVSPLSNLQETTENLPSDNSCVKETHRSHYKNRVVSACNTNNLVTIVNKRRHMLRKKRLIAKQKAKVDLLSALIALKKANINFVISNDSLIRSSTYSPPLATVKPYPIRAKLKPVKKNNFKRVTKELKCPLMCCTETYMVLKDTDYEEPSLLGFVEVKNENPLQEKWDFDKSLQEPLQCQKLRNSEDCVASDDQNNITVENEPVEIETVENRLSEENCNQIVKVTSKNTQVRRSKRTRSSIISALKKQKSITNKRLRMTDPDLPSRNHTIINEETPSKNSEVTKTNEAQEIIFKKPITTAKSLKTKFKRPVCRSRRSPRIVTLQIETRNENIQEKADENVILESPKSPVQDGPCTAENPVLIPLEKAPESDEKLPTSKIEMLFNKLIVYGAEEEASNEVVREFSGQEADYIAEAILERIAVDYHDAPDTKYNPAPLMTDVQRTMLGFMSKLEKTGVVGVFDSFLTLAEQRLLTCDNLQEFGPITRLYLAICKLHKNLYRMRRLCCDVFYFCGDFAVPFLFSVLTSWTEVLPHETISKDMPIARVLVQIIYTKNCNKPGYNLMPLRDLLIKFYGYPTEKWDVNEFFKDLFYAYLRNPVRSSDFALLLYCKNQPEKWVYEKIEQHMKPVVAQIPKENFKAAVIILIGNLYNRFSSKSEVNYLPKIREWFRSLLTETTPDVVRRSVYLCLNRLKKK